MDNGPVTRATKLLLAVLTPLLVAAGLAATSSPASAVGYGGYTDWRTISTGGAHTCGIRATGQLYCWGTDGTGSSAYPIAGGQDWKTVSVGDAHRCAIRGTGLLYCWGSDTYGQVGNGSDGSRSTPTRIGTNTSWKSVSAGSTHTCGILGAGVLYCWGSDTSGQLGNGGTATGNVTYPKRVGTGQGWKSVSAGGAHTCGIYWNSTPYCWGSDAAGQVGNGGVAESTVPSPTRISTSAWSSISAGGSHTCAIRGDGLLGCWGSDARGQLGNGSTATGNVNYPKAVGTNKGWKLVSAGGTNSCATYGTGALYCWGDNADRQTVEYGSASFYPSPARIATINWRMASAGLRHTCALPASLGKIYCWGAQRPPSTGLPAGTAYPATVLPLMRWKLTIPYDGSDSGTSADEIKWPALATYRSLSWFHSTSDNKAVVFRTPVGGAKTGGSVFARTEFRERTSDGDANCNWSNKSGTHTLRITQRVTHLPPKVPRVVVGQIHDPRDEVVMIRVDGSSILAEASYPDPAYEDGRKVQKPLKTGYRLGTYFTIRISAGPTGVAVFYNEGKSDAKNAWFADRVSRNTSEDKTTGDGWYFKAGMYLQTNTAKGDAPTEYGEGVIANLSISHSDGVCG